MIFSLPIGIYLLFQERRAMKSYQAIFDNFYREVKEDPNLSKEEKIRLLAQMLYQNNYHITEQNDHMVRGEKKIFSIGWLFVGIGTLYIGLLVYILYYLYFQKPHVVVFEV